jgi:poly(3-hydroxybutyrate) depolymerase
MSDLHIELSVDGQDREYGAHFPAGYNSDSHQQMLPMVLAMDGLTTNKPRSGMPEDNNIDQEADRDGFIAIYPLPKPRSCTSFITIRDWNASGVGFLPTDPAYNDVNYIAAVLKDTESRFNSDPSRVFAVGFSSGGEFVYDLEGTLPKGTFKGIATVEGTEFGTEPMPNAGTDAIIIHGDEDMLLPKKGGFGESKNVFDWPKIQAMRYFIDTVRADRSRPDLLAPTIAQVNGGTREPQTVDDGSYVESVYPTTDGVRVIEDDLKKGTHSWPGRPSGGNHESPVSAVNGAPVSADQYDANAKIFQFFGLHK